MSTPGSPRRPQPLVEQGRKTRRTAVELQQVARASIATTVSLCDPSRSLLQQLSGKDADRQTALGGVSPAHSDSVRTSRGSILVVEDNADVRDSLALLLDHFG